MPPKTIDDKLLWQLFTEEGITQKAIAERLQCTEGGVSRRLKILKKRYSPRPAILDALTDKQASFAMARAGGKSSTQAALEAFDCVDRGSAQTLGHRINAMPEVQEAITAIMEGEGLGRKYLVKKLAYHVDSDEPNVSLKAVDMGLKLHDSYPATKSVNMNIAVDVCPVDLSRYLMPGRV